MSNILGSLQKLAKQFEHIQIKFFAIEKLIKSGEFDPEQLVKMINELQPNLPMLWRELDSLKCIIKKD